MAKVKALFPIVAILVLSFFAWRPLLAPGFFPIHDDTQVPRLFEMDRSLRTGQFPVRWVADFGFGYGYPLFNYYPPMTYYLGEAFHLLTGAGFLPTIKVLWFTALAGSAIAMYFLAREFFGPTAGVVAAAYYLYAPYHAVDAYVRGALAELMALVWLPLILLFTYRLAKSNRAVVWLGISLALLITTHQVTFVAFFPFLLLWYLGVSKQALKGFLAAVLLGFGLSAFFWLPAFWEKGYTLIDQISITNQSNYTVHFVCPGQLWDSVWGYGGSVSGCLDGLSFKIGKLHVILALLALLMAVLRRSKILILTFILLAFAVFMTTDLSKFVWDRISLLAYIQFPWRYLGLVALFSSLMVGGLMGQIRRFKALFGLVLIAGAIFLYAKYFVPKDYYYQATDSVLTAHQTIAWYVSSLSFEYLPNNFPWQDIKEKDIAPQSLPSGFSLSGRQSPLMLPIVNFPGWQVFVDGQPAKISDNNKYRQITVTIPAGGHVITGYFGDTPVRRIGNVLTLVSLGLVAGFFLWKRNTFATGR
jgi:uncharacterized membrane protein